MKLYMFSEEVILAEERTTEEEKMHIIEGKIKFLLYPARKTFHPQFYHSLKYFNRSPKESSRQKEVKKPWQE